MHKSNSNVLFTQEQKQYKKYNNKKKRPRLLLNVSLKTILHLVNDYIFESNLVKKVTYR